MINERNAAADDADIADGDLLPGRIEPQMNGNEFTRAGRTGVGLGSGQVRSLHFICTICGSCG